MAEVIFRNIAKRNGRTDIVVKSAGIYADNGEPMMEEARLALIECGEEVGGKLHKSTRLTQELHDEFDRVIDVRRFFDPYGGKYSTYVDLCKQLQIECQKLYDAICKT